MLFSRNKTEIPQPKDALPGRAEAMAVENKHFVNGVPILPPFADKLDSIVFGMGCFWGAEKKFWEMQGVVTTAVGYAAGYTPNPSYEEVCSGLTGHNEVILVVFDPALVALQTILQTFWENHDPTQGMRQGNDAGTQYRSAIYPSSEQEKKAMESQLAYQQQLSAAGRGQITTEVRLIDAFYYAESYHQQYLAKNPGGYCGLGGTGVGFCA